jgi:hypothetical protein
VEAKCECTALVFMPLLPDPEMDRTPIRRHKKEEKRKSHKASKIKAFPIISITVK